MSLYYMATRMGECRAAMMESCDNLDLATLELRGQINAQVPDFAAIAAARMRLVAAHLAYHTQWQMLRGLMLDQFTLGRRGHELACPAD